MGAPAVDGCCVCGTTTVDGGGATAAVLKDQTSLDVTLVPVSIGGTPPPNLSLTVGSITMTGPQ